MLNKKFILLITILSLYSLVIAGCSNDVEANMEIFHEIKVGDNQTGENGDTIDSVQKKLGEPDQIFDEDQKEDISKETHTYHDILGEGTTVKVIYINDGVTEKNTNATID